MKRLIAILAAVVLLISAAGTAAAAVEINPWGCATYTDNPHLSGHYPGTVAAVAENRCAGYNGANRTIKTYPTYQTVEAWLYFEHCDFVIFCGWVQRDHWNSGQVSSSITIRPGHTLEANCVNNVSVKWRILANGSGYGYNGSTYKWYYASSEKVVTLACGG